MILKRLPTALRASLRRQHFGPARRLTATPMLDGRVADHPWSRYLLSLSIRTGLISKYRRSSRTRRSVLDWSSPSAFATKKRSSTIVGGLSRRRYKKL